MSENCPDRKTIEKYFWGELEFEQNKEIAEHFYSCQKCINEAREINNTVAMLKAVRAKPLLGLAWERYGDRIEEYKCAKDKNKNIKEFETINKKFKIILRPMECNDCSSLLEIRALDNSRNRCVLLYINGRIEKVEIDKNGIGCVVVNSDIDLKDLIIRYKG